MQACAEEKESSPEIPRKMMEFMSYIKFVPRDDPPTSDAINRYIDWVNKNQNKPEFLKKTPNQLWADMLAQKPKRSKIQDFLDFYRVMNDVLEKREGGQYRVLSDTLTLYLKWLEEHQEADDLDKYDPSEIFQKLSRTAMRTELKRLDLEAKKEAKASREKARDNVDWDAAGKNFYEFIAYANQLFGYRAGSLHSITLPKKGIAYLVQENAATQRVLNAMAGELLSWATQHMTGSDFRNKVPSAVLDHEILAKKPELLIALRIAQTQPVGSEKIYIGINRPLWHHVVEIGISFISIVGQLVAAREVIVGEDLFGYELSNVERGILAAGILLPFAAKGFKTVRAIYATEKLAAIYEPDVYKAWNASERMFARAGSAELVRKSRYAILRGEKINDPKHFTRWKTF